MAWLGKVIGVSVGAIFGPPGIAIGAALGSIVDAGSDPKNPFNLECAGRIDDIGSHYVLEITGPVPAQCVVVLHIRDVNQRYVKAVPRYQDRDGDFVILAPVEGGKARCFIPHTALSATNGEGFLLDAALVDVGASPAAKLTVETFRITLSRCGPWRPIDFLGPLVDLAMATACADAGVTPEEVRVIKHALVHVFDLTDSDLPALRERMKRPVRTDIADLVAALRFRLPNLELRPVLEFLAEVAKADGDLDVREVALLERVARAMDITPAAWPALQRELGLVAVDHHAVLGLRPGASLAEVKRAYRGRVRQYHPDQVVGLPIEFQRLAEQKTIELRTAYEALLRQLDRGGT